MRSRPVLLMQTGDAPTSILERHGNFDKMFFDSWRLDPEECRVVRVFLGEKPAAPPAYRSVVVTGSPAMVTDRLPWSEAAAEWLREAAAKQVPLFGVCYGHQLMSHAFGGEVAFLPDGSEVGTRTIRLTRAGRDHPLFRGYPEAFPANLAHSQSVVRLPAGAISLASSDRDPHQAIAYGPNAFSVQFHPEFNKAVNDAYLDFFADATPELADHCRNAQRAGLDTPLSRALLDRFLTDY